MFYICSFHPKVTQDFIRPSRESVTKAKKHPDRCFLINGTRYCAVIGLTGLRICKHF